VLVAEHALHGSEIASVVPREVGGDFAIFARPRVDDARAFTG
jgi:hypothetical protein